MNHTYMESVFSDIRLNACGSVPIMSKAANNNIVLGSGVRVRVRVRVYRKFKEKSKALLSL